MDNKLNSAQKYCPCRKRKIVLERLKKSIVCEKKLLRTDKASRNIQFHIKDGIYSRQYRKASKGSQDFKNVVFENKWIDMFNLGKNESGVHITAFKCTKVSSQ